MSVDLYKAEADRLYEHLSRKHGVKLKKSSILESVAILHGHPDWNTLVAVTRDQSSPAAGVSAPLSSETFAASPPDEFRLPTAEMETLWRERREKARVAQIEGARSRDSLEKIGIPQTVRDAWLASLLNSPSGVFFVCGPTGSGKTTAMFATACELTRQGMRVAQIDEIREYLDIEGNLYYSSDEVSPVLAFAQRLKTEGVNIVFVSEFISEGDRYLAYADVLASLGFRVVTCIHSSRIRARLEALNWADPVIKRALRAALHIRVVYNPKSNQSLPLTHLELHDSSGNTTSYGAPLELLAGLSGSQLAESELPYLSDFFANASQTGASAFEVRLMPKTRY